jgi:hypothetical protein
MKLTKLSAAWLQEWTCRLMPATVNFGRGHRFAAYPRCSADVASPRLDGSRRMNGLFRFPEAVRQDAAIDRWLEEQAPELGAIARTWFQRMRKRGRDVREVMHDGCPTACVEDAAFGYVGVFKAHVNVGFFRGAELGDPSRLLEGTGRLMRHVKVKPSVELDSGALVALIGIAYADMKIRLAAEHGDGSVPPSQQPKDRRRRRTRG